MAASKTRFLLKSTVEDAEGLLTPLGMSVAHDYALAWVRGARDYSLEKKYPGLAGLFYDLRNDDDLAQMHAS